MNSNDIIKRSMDAICERLDPLLRGATELSLLDFPNHPNVGDSAIWAGQLAYLESRNQRPSYVCSRDEVDWDALSALRGPILLCGGGNFGDVWPGHQLFRNELLSRFPDRKIIQLPQSIQFSSPLAAQAARLSIHNHPDFTLFVRDRRSLEQGRTLLGLEPLLVSDMAFCLGPISRPRAADQDLLLLLRTDKEKRQNDSTGSTLPGHVEDWLTDQKGFYKWSQLKTGVNPNNWRKADGQFALLKALANARLKRGLTLLAKHKFVITDRLHCHILCLLQDIPHVVMDNNYGKISNFIKAWTADYDHLELADDIKTAIGLYHAHASIAPGASPAIAMQEMERRA